LPQYFFHNVEPSKNQPIVCQTLPGLAQARGAAKRMMASHPLFAHGEVPALAVDDATGATLLVVPNHERVWLG
jgi:hypothetical protein